MAISIQKARMYEKFRLHYANKLVSGVLEHTGRIQVISDICAGTGQPSRMFVEHAPKIFAIEPDTSLQLTYSNVIFEDWEDFWCSMCRNGIT